MSFLTAKQVCEYHIGSEINDKIIKRIIGAIQGWLNKNDNHIEFFSGALLGYPSIAYGNRNDGGKWMHETLGIEDSRDYTKDLTSIPTVNENFKVSSDAITWTYVYITHLCLNAKGVDPKLARLCAIQCLVMMHARWLSGMMYTRFPHQSSPDIALALLESLDGRTDLKVHGSWMALLIARAEAILDDSRNGYGTAIKNMDDDLLLVAAINDLDRSLTVTVNVLTEKYYIVRQQQQRVISSSTTTMRDGEKVLKSYANKIDRLKVDLYAITSDRNAMIKKDLIKACVEIIPTTDERNLTDVLEYYVDNVTTDKMYRDLSDSIVTYIVNMSRVYKVDMNNIQEVISKLRKIFRSSRTQQEDALNIKDISGEIVGQAIPRTRESIRVATKIALVIYISLRLLTKNNYE